jgi:hypothetical protein
MNTTPRRCTCSTVASDGAPVGCFHDDFDRDDAPTFGPVDTRPAVPAPWRADDDEDF